MRILHLLTTLIIGLSAVVVAAQEPVCDTLSLALTGHGHGAITVSRVWVDDPDLFSISMERTLPFDATEGETFDVRVCILRQDGKTYKTKLRYETNHGSEAADVSLTAPKAVASISWIDESRRPRALVFPSPASNRIQIVLNRSEPGPIVIKLLDSKGEIVRHRALTDFPPRGVSLDVRDVCAGPYHLTVQIAGIIVGVHPIIVVR